MKEKKNERKKYLEYSENIYEEKYKCKLKKKYKIINIHNDKELLKEKKKKIASIKKYLKRTPSSFMDKIKKYCLSKENIICFP